MLSVRSSRACVLVLGVIAIAASLSGCFIVPNSPLESRGSMSVANEHVLIGWCGPAEEWTSLRVSLSSSSSTAVYSSLTAQGEFIIGGDEAPLDLSNLPDDLNLRGALTYGVKIDKMTVTVSRADSRQRIIMFDFSAGEIESWPSDVWLTSGGVRHSSMCG